MHIILVLPPIIDSALAHSAGFGVLKSATVLAYVICPVVAAFVGSRTIAPSFSVLQRTANRLYSRMRFLGLNETQLSERCSLAAVHLFEDAEAPSLTRDRVSKILMNRQHVPAKSAARIITNAELTVLANVLQVSVEWLIGQEGNRDPVVWNVLANPDRVVAFAHLLQAYEEIGLENRVWSQYPMSSLTSEAFVHAFNHVHFGRKPGIQNTRPLVEFYNSLARVRRKWILRPDRSFKYTNIIYQSHFEHVTCGAGVFSAISKTILTRNLDVMIDLITEPSLNLKLVILKDEYSTPLEVLRPYELVATVDNLFSAWSYYNGDVGWSEHSTYANPHCQLLERMMEHSLCQDVTETVEYINSLRSRLRRSPETLSRSTTQQIPRSRNLSKS